MDFHYLCDEEKYSIFNKLYRKLQSMGLTARSLENMVHLIAPSFKLDWKATARPKRIIYPTDFASLLTDKQKALMDEFVAAWEKVLNTKAEKISLADAWAKGDKQPLTDYLEQAASDAFSYDFYHNYDEFRSSFKAKFGQEPHAEPSVAEQWYAGHIQRLDRNIY